MSPKESSIVLAFGLLIAYVIVFGAIFYLNARFTQKRRESEALLYLINCFPRIQRYKDRVNRDIQTSREAQLHRGALPNYVSDYDSIDQLRDWILRDLNMYEYKLIQVYRAVNELPPDNLDLIIHFQQEMKNFRPNSFCFLLDQVQGVNLEEYLRILGLEVFVLLEDLEDLQPIGEKAPHAPRVDEGFFPLTFFIQLFQFRQPILLKLI